MKNSVKFDQEEFQKRQKEKMNAIEEQNKLKTVTLINKVGMTKEIRIGFSWFILLASIVALPERGMWKELFISILVSIVSYLILGEACFLATMSYNIYLAINASKIEARRYINKGFVSENEEDEFKLRNMGVYSL